MVTAWLPNVSVNFWPMHEGNMQKVKEHFSKYEGKLLEKHDIHTVCVVGLGYIGLPTAALMAARGYSVHGVDVNEKAVETINQGRIHIVEPDLDVFVRATVQSGNLKASVVPCAADVFMICVPTPFYHDGNPIPQPNMEYVVAATQAIAPYVKAGNLVILESTSPVGSTELVRDTLRQAGVDTNALALAYCPERVLPGKVMVELIENDRIVGGLDEQSTQKVKAFYDTFVAGEVLETDSRTAEMCKLTENSSRDVQIAFANELSLLCDSLNINVRELIRLANRHPRVNILQPGTGVGGHCIAVDPWFIVAKDPEHARIIRMAREINNYKTQWVIEKIKSAAYRFESENGRKAVVACMGLAFKPDIDDLRESPAVLVAETLQKEFAVVCVEPNSTHHDEFKLVGLDDALAQADVVAWLVGHREFKSVKVGKGIDFCG